MRLTRHLLPAVAVLTAALSAQAQYGPTGSGAPATPTVKVAIPTRGDVHRFVAQPGTVRPLQQATLHAKVPGYLRAIKVDKGDPVKAGQLIAELDAPELEADLARARGELTKARSDGARANADVAKAQAEVARSEADLANAGALAHKAEAELFAAKATAARAQAELPKAQAELEFANLDHSRLVEGRRKAPDLVVPAQVDASKAKLDTARAQIGVLKAAAEAAGADAEAAKARRAAAEATMTAVAAQAEATKASVEAARAVFAAAQATVTVAEANVRRTESLADFTRLTAPFDGVVTARFVDLGAFIPAATAGAPQSAAVVTVMDFNTVRVQVPVTELEAALVAKGQPVKVALDGLPGKVFEGTVTRFAGALDEATRTMLVEAELPNPGHALRPGMYATVRVGVEKHTNVILVPSEALVMEKIAAFLFLADGGKAKKTPVKIGFNDGARVEVISGLAENAKVILVGKMTLADGQAVNVPEGQ
ncbi:MAG: efflux RND transporter periplasmic adaptor subunit [Limisphaerales bacterium]